MSTLAEPSAAMNARPCGGRPTVTWPPVTSRGLQSGQYPTTTGVFRNDLTLPRSTPSLARTFRDAGYATGYIGKWHLAGDHTRGPVPEEARAGYEY